MSDDSAMQSEETFASGRYSKRKRQQITYNLDEGEGSDSDSDSESPQSKKRKAHTLSRPLPNRKVFPFLSLPAEIRNIIYTYALTDPAGIMLASTCERRRYTAKRSSAIHMMATSRSEPSWLEARMTEEILANDAERVTLASSLLAANKQIHQEAHDMLYGNEFILADAYSLYCFLVNIGPAKSRCLKTIRLLSWTSVRSSTDYNHVCFALLTWATNIVAFHLEAPAIWCHLDRTGVRQLYNDAYPWMKAMGAAAGKVDAVVEVLHLGEDYFTGKLIGVPIYERRTYQQCVDEFKTDLSELLKEEQKRVMGSPLKKR